MGCSDPRRVILLEELALVLPRWLPSVAPRASPHRAVITRFFTYTEIRRHSLVYRLLYYYIMAASLDPQCLFNGIFMLLWALLLQVVMSLLVI